MIPRVAELFNIPCWNGVGNHVGLGELDRMKFRLSMNTENKCKAYG